MPATIEVIASVRFVHKSTGQEASLYGAHPGPGWEMKIKGWTWRVTDRSGSVAVGLCRKAAATKAEATRIAMDVAAMRGLRLIGEVA